jgi:hypothetical protein
MGGIGCTTPTRVNRLRDPFCALAALSPEAALAAISPALNIFNLAVNPKAALLSFTMAYQPAASAQAEIQLRSKLAFWLFRAVHRRLSR